MIDFFFSQKAFPMPRPLKSRKKMQDIMRANRSDRDHKLPTSRTPISSDDPLKAYVSLLEKDVVDFPEYWLWSHNRWKN